MKLKKIFIKKNECGFTLIELLVVIAIIGLLSSVVLASLNSARGKARDAKRESDFGELRTALELYANDNNGKYPSTGGSYYGSGSTCSTFNVSGTLTTSGATGYIPNLAPAYIPVLPLDPKPFSPSGCYLYDSNGTDYILLTLGTFENPSSNPSPRQPLATPDRTTYAIYSAGGISW